MDVENDLCATQLGNDRREHLEVRHGVHMDDVVASLEVLPVTSAIERKRNRMMRRKYEILPRSFFSRVCTRSDPHAMDDLLAGLTRTAEHDGVDHRAFLRQRLCVAHDAPVVLVERVRQHASPHRTQHLALLVAVISNWPELLGAIVWVTRDPRSIKWGDVSNARPGGCASLIRQSFPTATAGNTRSWCRVPRPARRSETTPAGTSREQCRDGGGWGRPLVAREKRCASSTP